MKNLLLLFLITFLINCNSNSPITIKQVSAKEFKNKINFNVNIVDIRTNIEFKSGTIPGAVNIDFFEENFKKELNKLNKNKTLLFFCRSGNRTQKSLSIIKNLGFKNVLELRGGYNAWKAEKFEIKYSNCIKLLKNL